MPTTARRSATRRLPQPVKDYVAEGGTVLASDDEQVFAVGESSGQATPVAKSAGSVRYRGSAAGGRFPASRDFVGPPAPSRSFMQAAGRAAARKPRVP